MRRLACAVLIGVAAVMLTGCPVAPAGYQPPRLESYQVTPQPAHPGDSITFVLDVTDDRGIASGFARRMITPTGSLLSETPDCTWDTAPQGSFEHVVITSTCTV